MQINPSHNNTQTLHKSSWRSALQITPTVPLCSLIPLLTSLIQQLPFHHPHRTPWDDHSDPQCTTCKCFTFYPRTRWATWETRMLESMLSGVWWGRGGGGLPPTSDSLQLRISGNVPLYTCTIWRPAYASPARPPCLLRCVVADHNLPMVTTRNGPFVSHRVHFWSRDGASRTAR